MKIAILSLFFPPRWVGGTETATLNLARELAKNPDNEIYVLTSENKWIQNLKENFKIIPIQTSSIPKFKVFSYVFNSSKVLKAIDPDVVHCQSIITGLAPLWAKKPYLVYCRGFDVYCATGIFKRINKNILKKAKLVLSLTKGMQDKLKKDYRVKSKVLHNGIRLREIKKDNTFKNRIVYLGNLKKVKRVDDLIKAFSIVQNRIPDAFLDIYGDGLEKESLMNLISKLGLQRSVAFNGSISNESVFEVLPLSDLLVLPSNSEGFPVCLLEAMVCGLPIVATDTDGSKEVIKNGSNGFLVPVGDIESMATAMIKVLNDKKLAEKMRQSNLEIVKKYSLEKVAKKLEEFYKEI